jgi:adenylate kinase family enzyme
MKRIAVIGTTGSGKSTLAKRLGARLKMPVNELDTLHWLPNWVERDTASFRGLVDEATRGEYWITEGGYSEVRDYVWGRADTIVWVNLPFWTTFKQLFLRTVRRARTREPICNGNTETWRLSFFSNESVLLWLFKSYWRRQREYPEVFRTLGEDKRIVVLRSHEEIDAFIAQPTHRR